MEDKERDVAVEDFGDWKVKTDKVEVRFRKLKQSEIVTEQQAMKTWLTLTEEKEMKMTTRRGGRGEEQGEEEGETGEVASGTSTDSQKD